MIKIGITGSLASGKTTASKILSANKGPLFVADREVKKLYKKKSFKNLLSKKFNIDKKKNIKSSLKKIITKDISNLTKLEQIIHPLVRKEMRKFIKKYKNKKLLFFEIPLLIESNLMKNFDIIFLIKANKKTRIKRFVAKGGNPKFFETLNKKQLDHKTKAQFCDYIVVNEKKLKIFKIKLLDIFKRYERSIS